MTFFTTNKPFLLIASGLLAVLGFSPFGVFPLTVLALAVLFSQWQGAQSARQAARMGFQFGLGLFAFGVGWIYVALHDYGNMHFLLALAATLLFAALLALFPALAGYVQARLRVSGRLQLLLAMPACWVLGEWLRGTLFTGFPWLAFGYSQAAASPLAGYAPLLGVYGVSLMVALSAALLALLARARWSREGQLALAALLLLWVGGALLRNIEWTQPQGAPVKVALLQGNVPQDIKFDEGRLVGTLELYRRMIQQSDAQLIVLPETALPLLRHELPESYADIVSRHARANGGDVLIGAFERDENRLYYNSVFTLGVAPGQSYRKNHLVPFGEFIPLRPVLGWFINEVLDIPMGDLTSGGRAQLPLNVAGQKVAVDICYEDVFGEEIIRALPAATLLVNATNDAWYGDSYAAMQHNQIAQMRALETGRMMLRATNTGVTSVIGTDGRIRQMLPQHEEGTLTAEVQGYAGSTPYVRCGNATVLALLVLMLVVAWRWRGR
ncbi:MAG: apolipoprotein N-acyltransferase [Sideroxydans sp.]|nr:apolipoprotein N-acyltransferase [Sideroxydans sp.]